jgi:hypothetical protein
VWSRGMMGKIVGLSSGLMPHNSSDSVALVHQLDDDASQHRN